VDASWDTIPVPSNWQLHGYGVPNYCNAQYPYPVDPPHVPDDNPVGIYRRTFHVPPSWEDRRVFLHFDGVDSAFYVAVNGQVVGCSKGSHLPSEFDITSYLRPCEGSCPSENLLAVHVFQWSDGSYLEDQDKWRLSGIFRDVSLFATPIVHMRDVAVRTQFDRSYTDGVLDLAVELRNYAAEEAKGYSVAAHLCDEGGQVVAEGRSDAPSPAIRRSRWRPTCRSLRRGSGRPKSPTCTPCCFRFTGPMGVSSRFSALQWGSGRSKGGACRCCSMGSRSRFAE